MSKQPPATPTAQAQQVLALLSSKLVGRPGTESLPSTFAPHDHPPFCFDFFSGKYWERNVPSGVPYICHLSFLPLSRRPSDID